MNCLNHPDRGAAGTCAYCGKPFCSECLVDVYGRNFCRAHVDRANGQSQQQYQYAPPQPDIHIHNINTNMGGMGYYPYKSRIIAFFLCFFFGVLGIHRFYVGKTGTGILYLFTGGLLGIGWLVDLVMILFGSFTDRAGFPLRW